MSHPTQCSQLEVTVHDRARWSCRHWHRDGERGLQAESGIAKCQEQGLVLAELGKATKEVQEKKADYMRDKVPSLLCV